MISIGEVAYNAYRKKTMGKTHDGREMPPWDGLGPNIQDAWQAAALAVSDLSNPISDSGLEPEEAEPID